MVYVARHIATLFADWNGAFTSRPCVRGFAFQLLNLHLNLFKGMDTVRGVHVASGLNVGTTQTNFKCQLSA